MNRAAGAALAEAGKEAGIEASTGRYDVSFIDQPKPHWQAGEMIELRTRGGAQDGTALLALVGRLQDHGLAVQSLAWQLSDAASRHAHDAAQREALQALRGHATTAARLLGLRFAGFKEVDLDGPAQPVPFAPRMMALAAAPAPVAQTDSIPVTATVRAEAVLEAPPPDGKAP